MSPTKPAPTLELAEVIRRHAGRLADLGDQERRVLEALAACRTSALGGHVEVCDHCRHQRISYNSCGNRHCPKCQGSAGARWVEARAAELLPVEYFHVVFTLPGALHGVALSNKRAVYNVLFDAVAQTLGEVAADPRHLGARIGFLAVLHTWGQNLCLHPHLHCVVPGGGLSPAGDRFVGCRPGFFLPVRVLSRVFRGKFVDLLRRVFEKGKLRGIASPAVFEGLMDQATSSDWVVYAKPPFGGPEQVLKYLARYTHRIAISNSRLVSMDDRSVSFRWKDYAHGGQARVMTLEAGEFLRRFLLHVVPPGFVRIRHFGLLGNRVRRGNVERCRQLLGGPAAEPALGRVPKPVGDIATEPAIEDRGPCPVCGRGQMMMQRIIPRPPRSARPRLWQDSS